MLQNSGASSSSQDRAASSVPTVLNPSSSGTTILLRVGQASRKRVRTWDRETVVSSLFESVSWRKREIETKTLCKHCWTSNISKNVLKRRGELAVQKENRLSKVTKDEADVNVKHWGKRNSEIPLGQINQELESQRLKLQQGNQSADDVHRGKTKLCG